MYWWLCCLEWKNLTKLHNICCQTQGQDMLWKTISLRWLCIDLELTPSEIATSRETQEYIAPDVIPIKSLRITLTNILLLQVLAPSLLIRFFSWSSTLVPRIFCPRHSFNCSLNLASTAVKFFSKYPYRLLGSGDCFLSLLLLSCFSTLLRSLSNSFNHWALSLCLTQKDLHSMTKLSGWLRHCRYETIVQCLPSLQKVFSGLSQTSGFSFLVSFQLWYFLLNLQNLCVTESLLNWIFVLLNLCLTESLLYWIFA